MTKNYKYSNLKRETSTSGEVTLSPVRKRKTDIPHRGSKQPAWAVAMESRINGHLNQIDSRLDRVERQIHFVADKTNVDLQQMNQNQQKK